MAGTVKKLQFSEGTDVGAPTDLSLATSTTVIEPYPDDAAYVTANGTATQGDVYLNTTTRTIRMYIASSWRSAWIETDPTDATKLIVKDLTGQTNNTTLTLASVITANRTITFPDETMTVSGRANSETLSNKTLASPLISGGTVDVASAGNLAIGASVGANNLDLGGATTNTRILGNLEVQGTTTSVNTATLEVEDQNILVNNGGTDMSSEGAGLTVERVGTNGSLIYKDASATKWALGALGSEVDAVGLTSTQTLTNKTISGAANTITNVSLTSGVTGTLPIGNGGTGQTTANTALNALLPAQAGNAGLYLQTDGSNTSWVASGGSAATPTVAGLVTSYFADVDSSVLSSSSATINVSTTDGYRLIECTATGTAAQTINLPAVASNLGRVLTIIKTGDSTGQVTIDPNSSETIGGNSASNILGGTASYMNGQGSRITLIGTSSGWLVSDVFDFRYEYTNSTINAGAYISPLSVVIPPGRWLYTAQGYVDNAASATFLNVGISATSATADWLGPLGVGDSAMSAVINSSTAPGSATVTAYLDIISSNTTRYLTMRVFGANSTYRASFKAVRVG
jgi:hypothetical protein